MPNQITIEHECDECGGTGLYVGAAERYGAAVVCDACEGAGWVTTVFNWIPFTARRHRTGVIRVHECNPGIVITADPEFGGISIEDWEQGKPFPKGSENRKYTCPAWWLGSLSDASGPFDECASTGRFYECSRFLNKQACWEQWDKQGESDDSVSED